MNRLAATIASIWHSSASPVEATTRAVVGLSLTTLVVSACVKVLWFM